MELDMGMGMELDSIHRSAYPPQCDHCTVQIRLQSDAPDGAAPVPSKP